MTCAVVLCWTVYRPVAHWRVALAFCQSNLGTTLAGELLITAWEGWLEKVGCWCGKGDMCSVCGYGFRLWIHRGRTVRCGGTDSREGGRGILSVWRFCSQVKVCGLHDYGVCHCQVLLAVTACSARSDLSPVP